MRGNNVGQLFHLLLRAVHILELAWQLNVLSFKCAYDFEFRKAGGREGGWGGLCLLHFIVLC